MVGRCQDTNYHCTPIPAFIFWKKKRWTFLRSRYEIILKQFRQWSADGGSFQWQLWHLNLSRHFVFREREKTYMWASTPTHQMSGTVLITFHRLWFWCLRTHSTACMPLASFMLFLQLEHPSLYCLPDICRSSFRTQIKCHLLPNEAVPPPSRTASIRCQST